MLRQVKQHLVRCSFLTFPFRRRRNFERKKMVKSRVDIACRNNAAFGVSDDDIGEASD